MSRFITNVKQAGGVITITYSQFNGVTGGFDVFIFKSKEAPLPDWNEAIVNVSPVITDIANLGSNHIIMPECFKFGFYKPVKGEHDESVLSFVVQVRIKLNSNPAGRFVLTTPERFTGKCQAKHFSALALTSEKMNTPIYAFYSEAEKYLDGKRAQGDLFST